ncbi:hypothetical protein HNP92_001793 [Methanococcus maripaludis]|uniref:Uncharacterized protein n=1 Tax=Methanococcus maripaludis TaxID=39152 RepID=A0A7J9S6N9_METMI|nr:hypothetical protein [Methanococcus maripaludis]MBB6402471.1 hypothetical protein [Methanococcus maripaludis]
MNITWILTVTIASIALYGLLDETIKRNFKYLLDYIDYIFFGIIWITIYASLSRESFFTAECNDILTKLCNGSENPFSTLSFMLGTFLGITYYVKLNYSSIFKISGFMNSLKYNYDKKKYSDVLNDLDNYFKGLEMFLFYPKLQEKCYIIFNYCLMQKGSYFKNVTLHNQLNFYKNNLINLLNIFLNNLEFVKILVQIYPDLAVNLLKSTLDFNKGAYWEKYSLYLLLTQNSKFSEEIDEYESYRLAYGGSASQEIPCFVYTNQPEFLFTLLTNSHIEHNDLLMGIKNALFQILIKNIHEISLKDLINVKSPENQFKTGILFIELLYAHALKYNEESNVSLKYDALYDLFLKIENEICEECEKSVIFKKNNLTENIDYLEEIIQIYNFLISETQNSVIFKNLESSNIDPGEDGQDVVYSLYHNFLKIYILICDKEFLKGVENRDAHTQNFKNSIFNGINDIKLEFRNNRKNCTKKLAIAICELISDPELEKLYDKDAKRISISDLDHYIEKFEKHIKNIH